MKQLLAGALTLALIGFLLWNGLRRGAEPPRPEAAGIAASAQAPGAEARLQGLLDSARSGDVDAYLGAFTGSLRDRLDREVRERGRETFAADLRRSAGARKSHALFAPEPDGPGAVRVVVETVYPDRNERQTYRLIQDTSSDDWLVADVETVRGEAPTARFGTPAQYMSPEGVPVQGLAPAPDTKSEPDLDSPTP